MVGLIAEHVHMLILFRFLYDFVTFPNGVFSGTIISSVIHNNDIKKTAEWQLLLSSIALPGVFVGALLCNPLGRRNTVSSQIQSIIYFQLEVNERTR
jgi:hypothetical protein